jgi:hypothetical protein
MYLAALGSSEFDFLVVEVELSARVVVVVDRRVVVVVDRSVVVFAAV